MVFKTVLTQTVVLEMKNTLSWSKLHTVIIWNTFFHFLFGFVRSSRSNFLRPVQTCLEQSIFIILAEVSFGSLSGLFQVSLRSLSGLSQVSLRS